MNLRKLLIIIIMDIALLVELVFSISIAVVEMSTVASTFCTYFIPMAAFTIIGARLALKYFGYHLLENFTPIGIIGPLKQGKK